MNGIKINLVGFNCVIIKIRDHFYLRFFNSTRVFHFLIPTGISLTLNSNILTFTSSQPMEKVLFQFCSKVKNSLSSEIKTYRLAYFFAGVGFRGYFSESGRILSLKLGFTNIIHCKIPDYVLVKLTKKSIVLESRNRVVLGNFGNYLQKLRPFNSYKLKGIIPKNSSIPLKVVKKK